MRCISDNHICLSYRSKQQLAWDQLIQRETLQADTVFNLNKKKKKKKRSRGKMALFTLCRTSHSKLWSVTPQQIPWTCCIKTLSVLVKCSSAGLIMYERSSRISWHLLLLLLHAPTFLYPVCSKSPFHDKNHKLNIAWASLVCLLL